MANYRTLGSDFSTGLRAPHYTNGRLLTAEDLRAEQSTTLERQAQVGRAAGHGVVDGFDVAAAANKSALRISAGLGLNRNGQVIQLRASSVTLPVQPVTPAGTPMRRAPRFEACSGEDSPQPPSTAAGAYLLTAAPLAQLEGFVPRKSCDGTGTGDCANQWEVEGIEFKIIRLAAYQPPTGSRANRNRNLLAHWFYGSDEIVTLMRDPLQFGAAYSGFNRIAAEDYSACDLPLAVFFWANNQIAFVDQWAVRRRVVHPYAAAGWAANLSDERQAEGQARFLQFQEQASALQAAFGPQTGDLRAVDHFGYLPPVGILPVNPFELIVADIFDAVINERQIGLISQLNLTPAQVLERVRTGVLNSLGNSGGGNAFSLERFFGGLLPPQYQIVHEDLVHDRLHQSWVQPPIVLPPPPSPSPQSSLFDIILSDGVLVAVNDDNFGAILDNISSNFSGSVFNFAPAPTLTAPPPVPAPPLGAPAEGQPAFRPELRFELRPNLRAALRADLRPEILPGLAGTRFNQLRNIAVFRPPRDIFNPPADATDEIDPLVDILVVDELLDPYRDELTKTMSGRIDDAIVSLSGAGGIFVGANTYSAVNNSIGNAFTLNQFLWQGALVGQVDFGQLIDFINAGKEPVFYVVFVRRRPPVVNRPLRL